MAKNNPSLRDQLQGVATTPYYRSTYERILDGVTGTVKPTVVTAEVMHPRRKFDEFDVDIHLHQDKDALRMYAWIKNDLFQLGFEPVKLLKQFALQPNYFVTIDGKYRKGEEEGYIPATGSLQYATRVRLQAMRDSLNEYVRQHNAKVEELAPVPTSGKPVQEELVVAPLALTSPESQGKIEHAINEHRNASNTDVLDIVTRVSQDTLGMRKTLGMAVSPTLNDIHATLKEVRDLLKAALQ